MFMFTNILLSHVYFSVAIFYHILFVFRNSFLHEKSKNNFKWQHFKFKTNKLCKMDQAINDLISHSKLVNYLESLQSKHNLCFDEIMLLNLCLKSLQDLNYTEGQFLGHFIWEKLNTGHWKEVKIIWRYLFTVSVCVKIRALAHLVSKTHFPLQQILPGEKIIEIYKTENYRINNYELCIRFNKIM